MNALRPLTLLLCSAGLCAFVGLSALTQVGCTTTPAPRAERHELLPAGTVAVFSRRSTGSYGEASGPVTWAFQPGTWEGRAVVMARSDKAGAAVMDAATFGVVATLDGAGRVVYAFDPPWGHPWPLEPGRQWTTRHQLKLMRSGQVLPVETTWTVEAREQVSVPAGTFMTWRVRSVDSLGETQVVWSAPEQGLHIVRRILDRTASAPQGAGHLEGELVSVQRPQ